MLSYIKQPAKIEAVYNPIEVVVNKSGYTLGDLFYLELYVVPNNELNFGLTNKSSATLLTTFIKNGNGSGNCTFDLSNALTSLYTSYFIPDSNSSNVQVDTTAIKAYYYKVGYITYDEDNLQVKNLFDESSIKFTLRSAYNFDSNIDERVSERYLPEISTSGTTSIVPAYILTGFPFEGERNINENTFIPVLVPKRNGIQRTLELRGDIYYKSGSVTANKLFKSTSNQAGGIFIFNLQPSLYGIPNYRDIDYIDAWVEYVITTDISDDFPEV